MAFSGGGTVAPGVTIASVPVGDEVAVETGCVGLGDEVPVAGIGVPDGTGPGVAVRAGEVGGVTLAGAGIDGVTEGVTGEGVGVMVGTVWFGGVAVPSARPTSDPQASSRSTNTIATATTKGRTLIGLSLTLHPSQPEPDNTVSLSTHLGTV